MQQLVPNQFLFRFAYRCRYRKKFAGGARIVDLPADYRVPYYGAMDGQRPFAELRMAWNETGLAIVCQTSLKEEPIYGEPGRQTGCDGLSFWLDTRDTRTIHRASRYCQRFIFMAHNGEDPPVCQAYQKKLHRALDDAPAADLSQIRIAVTPVDDSAASAKRIVNYRLEVLLPAETLSGFDPETSTRLGFFYRLRDRELGDQLLTQIPEMPYWEDPSLWSVLELVK